MSKKKIFALICLFFFISWSLISLYYYNKHILTVKEYKVGERIEVSEGIIIIYNIEIHDFERRHFAFDRHKWFYESVLPKIPVSLQHPIIKALNFYSQHYNFDLGINDIEGRIMYVYSIYVSDEEVLDNDSAYVKADVFTKNGRNLTSSSGGHMRTEGSNVTLLHSRSKFFLNEYSPTSSDSLIINVKHNLSEKHEIIIEPTWETKKYNFFNKPPAEYSFSPGNVASSFIRVVVYDEDLNTVEGLTHPEIKDLPLGNMEHDEWSRTQGRITKYIGRYLEFDDVFATNITFGNIKDNIEDTVFEQMIYMVDYDGEWRIIDISPLTYLY